MEVGGRRRGVGKWREGGQEGQAGCKRAAGPCARLLAPRAPVPQSGLPSHETVFLCEVVVCSVRGCIERSEEQQLERGCGTREPQGWVPVTREPGGTCAPGPGRNVRRTESLG